jgi:hypothetical protein
MLLIASILGVVGAALFRRRAGTTVRLRHVKERLFGAASTKTPIHTEKR